MTEVNDILSNSTLSKYKNLLNPALQNNTDAVFFKPPSNEVNPKFFVKEKESVTQHIEMMSNNFESIQIIDEPEIVQIDYSKMKEYDLFSEFGQKINFYKDGIIFGTKQKCKKYSNFIFEDQTGSEGKAIYGTGIWKFISLGDNQYYADITQIDKLLKIKDNFIIYVLMPDLAKHKLIKINFGKNKWVNILCDEMQNAIKHRGVEDFNAVLSHHVPQEFKDKHLFPALHAKDLFDLVLKSDEQSLGTEWTREKFHEKGNFEDLLRAGSSSSYKIRISPKRLNNFCYTFTIVNYAASFINHINYLVSENKLENHPDNPKNFNDLILDLKQNREKLFSMNKLERMDFTANIVFKHLFEPKNLNVDELRKYIIKNKHCYNLTDYYSIDRAPYLQSYLLILLYFTNKGTTLPVYQNKKNVLIESLLSDSLTASSFWMSINPFILVSGHLEPSNGTTMHTETNKEKTYYLRFNKAYSNLEKEMNGTETYEDIKAETKDEISVIIDHIETSGTGEWIPYNACHDIKDPFYKYLRFVETKDEIIIFVTNQDNRVLCECYDKNKKDFMYWIKQRVNMENIEDFYVGLMATIRDFKVCVDRDRTMIYQGPRVPTGCNPDLNPIRYIYLPRRRYVKRTDNACEVSNFLKESRTFSGTRREHSRKLPHGSKASRFQLLLAEKNNFPLQEGFTYVKESIWGKNKMSEKEIRYRSNNFGNILFADPEEIKQAEKIDALGPAGFEEYCSKIMANRGWEIVDRNNYDGGIDIRAYRESKNGTVEKLLAQCKHWKKNAINPGVVRDFITAMNLEKEDVKKVGMIISSGRFSSGAVDLAREHDIQLICIEDIQHEVE